MPGRNQQLLPFAAGGRGRGVHPRKRCTPLWQPLSCEGLWQPPSCEGNPLIAFSQMCGQPSLRLTCERLNVHPQQQPRASPHTPHSASDTGCVRSTKRLLSWLLSPAGVPPHHNPRLPSNMFCPKPQNASFRRELGALLRLNACACVCVRAQPPSSAAAHALTKCVAACGCIPSMPLASYLPLRTTSSK